MVNPQNRVISRHSHLETAVLLAFLQIGGLAHVVSKLSDVIRQLSHNVSGLSCFVRELSDNVFRLSDVVRQLSDDVSEQGSRILNHRGTEPDAERPAKLRGGHGDAGEVKIKILPEQRGEFLIRLKAKEFLRTGGAVCERADGSVYLDISACHGGCRLQRKQLFRIRPSQNGIRAKELDVQWNRRRHDIFDGDVFRSSRS